MSYNVILKQGEFETWASFIAQLGQILKAQHSLIEPNLLWKGIRMESLNKNRQTQENELMTKNYEDLPHENTKASLAQSVVRGALTTLLMPKIVVTKYVFGPNFTCKRGTLIKQHAALCTETQTNLFPLYFVFIFKPARNFKF